MAMKKSQSLSDGWREKGNNFYRKVTEGLSPSLQITRLQEASNCYGRALSSAKDDKERSSACKNSAMANWKLANAHMANGGRRSTIIFYFKGALSNFQDAKDCGRRQTAAWHDSLTDAAERCWFDVSAMMDGWETEVRVCEMQQLVGYIIDDPTKAREYLEITNHYFHWSLTALGERDYRQCLSLLKDCHFPLKEAQRYGRDVEILMHECALLEEDIYTQTCVAESIQERVKGEELLNLVVQDEEVLNIDMIWEVVDSFRMAAHMTRDRDLEMEAMALSDLGMVYDKILKLKDRAKACLMKVLELANTMVPRNFTGEEWYELARSTVERYQQENVRADEQQHEKEREEVLKLLKDDLDTLNSKKIKLTKTEFLEFVYATYPPKNPEHKLGEGELKKLYLKAVVHYHPDKVSVEEHGKKWKVLSEEITKLLSSHYEEMKKTSK